MKSIGMFYFSGTGNTEIVANMLKSAFGRCECDVDLIRIEDVMKGGLPIDDDKYEYIGIGAQVIGYGIPNLVKDFLQKLPRGTGQKVFIFRTAGGVAPVNYNASKFMIRTLNGKGYNVVYERIFSISSNWIFRFNDAVIRDLYVATGRKADLMVREVLQGEKRFLKTGIGKQIFMETVAFLSSGFFRLMGQDYTISSSCSHCGLCIKQCPAKNIYEKNGSIKFRLNCSGCLRCVYSCPKKAIQFRLLTFFPVAGGYNIQKILGKTLPTEEKIDGKIPPFFNEYLVNDAL